MGKDKQVRGSPALAAVSNRERLWQRDELISALVAGCTSEEDALACTLLLTLRSLKQSTIHASFT